jgi:hypothetical protein
MQFPRRRSVLVNANAAAAAGGGAPDSQVSAFYWAGLAFALSFKPYQYPCGNCIMHMYIHDEQQQKSQSGATWTTASMSLGLAPALSLLAGVTVLCSCLTVLVNS